MFSSKKGFFLLLFLLFLITAFSFWHYLKTTYYIERKIVERQKLLPRKEIKKFDNTLVFVGDSMTEYLGNMEELNYFLKKYYPQKNILLLNYGYSATNILSLQDRLEKDSTHSGRIYQAMNDINFDYIFIESFGNNPLSDFPLDEGLKKQTETLDKAIESITKKHPKSSIIFIATISPNSKYYGKGSVDLSLEERKKWSDERSEYIKNHIKYAKDHNIPVIDIYEKSKNWSGDGSLKYLSKEDYIHPSVVGIYFIDDQIAKFINQLNLLKGN